jgi:pimeloyl-ACP methyl ester carboxylesterase
LSAGGTYNRTYWDFPYQPERYSYQRDMASRGYATFAVDRLGSGQSSKPPSATLLGIVEAASIHQVVGRLRAGLVGGLGFDRVVLVGHSLGAGIATLEAATYHDVDGVILTGVTHLPPLPPQVTFFTSTVYPVDLDPQLRRNGSDPGYFTTRPGQRAPAFYVTRNADPRVIATDEETKDQAAISEIVTETAVDIIGSTSLGIQVPVLLAVGSDDFFFCGFLARDCSSADALRKGEALYFSPAAHLSTYVLLESGHSIALHKNSGEYREVTRAWLRAHITS